MKEVINKLKQAVKNTKFENHTFLVGGFVRDQLMERTSDDIDIVVDLPNGGIELSELLYKKGISSRPVIYRNFGTALTVIDGVNIELVMTRKESYRNNSRKPQVKPATLKEDAQRRDFTINAIYQNLVTEEIFDLTGKGISDIKDKIIRTVIDADKVFNEDPLRMLRAVKFAVKLNFLIEESTYLSLKNNAYRLEIISVERIKEEFIKIITSNKPGLGIKMLIDTDLMNYIIPEFKEILDVPQNKYHNLNVLEHTIKVVENVKPTPILRISALLHDIGKGRTYFKDENGDIHFHKHEVVGAKMAVKILNRLRFSNKFIKEVEFLIRNHLRTKQYGKNAELVTDKTIRRLILNSGDYLEDLLALIDADNKVHAPEYSMPNQISNLKMRIKSIENKMETMPISGDDIKERFNLKEGKLIGEYLSKAKEKWLENPQISKEELLEYLKSS